MTFRTIVAVLHNEKDSKRVLDSALPLATRFSAHLIGVHSEALPVPIGSPLGLPDVEFMQTSAEEAERRSKELEALFSNRAEREGVRFEWRTMESLSGDSALSAIHIARASDLVVVQQTDPDELLVRVPNNEALLFDTGRPVLFLPYVGEVDTSFSKVVVAWNGTSEAARAAFDALPFIKAARETLILSVDPRDDDMQDAAVSGTDIAEALSRHGAKVTLSTRDSAGLSPGTVIENEISDTGANLLVMGAFSQSWLKEFFFGGTTRTLLNSMSVATLMSR